MAQRIISASDMRNHQLNNVRMRSYPMNQYKEIAANAGAEQLENGMIVGLGSGTTSELALAAIGRRVKQGLSIIGIPTSERIAGLARELGIPLATLAEHPRVDVTIDGADEVQT